MEFNRWCSAQQPGMAVEHVFLRVHRFNMFLILFIFQGKYDEARPLFVRATEILGNVLHPLWLATTALNNRAAFVESQVRPKRVREPAKTQACF